MMRNPVRPRSLRSGRVTFVLLLFAFGLPHCWARKITRPYRKPVESVQFRGKRLLIALPEVRGKDKSIQAPLSEALLGQAPALKTKLYEKGHLVNIGGPAKPYVEHVQGDYGPYTYRIRAVAEAIRTSGAEYLVLPLVDRSTGPTSYSWQGGNFRYSCSVTRTGVTLNLLVFDAGGELLAVASDFGSHGMLQNIHARYHRPMFLYLDTVEVEDGRCRAIPRADVGNADVLKAIPELLGRVGF